MSSRYCEESVERARVRLVNARRPGGLTDLRLTVLPGHTPQDIAKGLRAEEDVDEIAKRCADLALWVEDLW